MWQTPLPNTRYRCAVYRAPAYANNLLHCFAVVGSGELPPPIQTDRNPGAVLRAKLPVQVYAKGVQRDRGVGADSDYIGTLHAVRALQGSPDGQGLRAQPRARGRPPPSLVRRQVLLLLPHERQQHLHHPIQGTLCHAALLRPLLGRLAVGHRCPRERRYGTLKEGSSLCHARHASVDVLRADSRERRQKQLVDVGVQPCQADDPL
jgi:hypothetical protein